MPLLWNYPIEFGYAALIPGHTGLSERNMLPAVQEH